MVTLNVTLKDPQGRLSELPLLVPTLRAALEYIDSYLVIRGSVDVEVVVETTSTGRFAGGGDISYAGDNNALRLKTWEASLIAESRTGVDPNPSKPDLSIYVDPASSYLAQLYWDPAIATSLSANPPDDRTDAFSVIVHELLHGMGITGWRDIESGRLPQGADYQSVWDSQVQLSGGRASFSGPATTALLGQPVEVRLGGTQGAVHLGNGPGLAASAMPWIERSNFNSYYYYLGERYTLGRLELALLQDLGWTLESGITLTDVVNNWDDRPNARYLVGWETHEQLSGDMLDDRIEGRGGDDLLVGLQGADTLLGGNGKDTLEGGAGNDTLTGGAGNDVFYFTATNQGVDLITDFAAGDRVEVAAALKPGVPTQGTGSGLTGRQVQVSSDGTVTTLWVDTDGTAGAELQIRLTGNFAASGWIVESAAANTALPGEAASVIRLASGAPLTPTIQFTTTSGSANEGNSGSSTVTVQATLSAASTQAVAVPITYSGTAISGTDYTSAPASLTIAAGQTTGTATFSVVGDTAVEANETVVLTLGTPTNATLGVNTSYTHTIVNDDTEQAPTTRTHTLTVLVDKGVLGTDPVLLKDLVEKVTTAGTTVTAHTVSYEGIQFKYADVDALITTVIRDGEFTEEFRKEIAEQYPSFGSITYRDAVSFVGIANIDATLISVAGMDGNFVA